MSDFENDEVLADFILGRVESITILVDDLKSSLARNTKISIKKISLDLGLEVDSDRVAKFVDFLRSFNSNSAPVNPSIQTDCILILYNWLTNLFSLISSLQGAVIKNTKRDVREIALKLNKEIESIAGRSVLEWLKSKIEEQNGSDINVVVSASKFQEEFTDLCEFTDEVINLIDRITKRELKLVVRKLKQKILDFGHKEEIRQKDKSLISEIKRDFLEEKNGKNEDHEVVNIVEEEENLISKRKQDLMEEEENLISKRRQDLVEEKNGKSANYKIIILRMSDYGVSKSVVKSAIAHLANSDFCILGNFRPCGEGKAIDIKLSSDDADRIVRVRKIVVGCGWGIVTEKYKITKCFKCWSPAHIAKNCTFEDRRNMCFNCGSKNHKIKECNNKTWCGVCNLEGHRAGTMKCKIYCKELKTFWMKERVRNLSCFHCGITGHLLRDCFHLKLNSGYLGYGLACSFINFIRQNRFTYRGEDSFWINSRYGG